ncbi:MAG: hypothetical protein V5A46_03390 [Haloferacaceae archaeon]
MGLRCLFGHDFTEPELERERETSGGEVVITVREVKTCRRCGETQVVSENKEVTSVEQLAETARAVEEERDSRTAETERAPGESIEPDAEPAATEPDAEAAPTDGETPPAEAGATTAEPDESEEPDADPDAEVLSAASSAAPDAEATDGETGEPADGSVGGDAPESDLPVEEAEETGDAGEAETDAASDDGVILEDDAPTDPNRERGAWPDAGDTRQEGAAGPAAESDGAEASDGSDGAAEPWPDQRGEDEGYDAEPGGGTPEGVSFEDGLTPEAAADPSPEDDEGVEFIEGTADAPTSGGGWPDPTDAAEETAPSTGPGGETPPDAGDAVDAAETDAAEADTDADAAEAGFTRVDDAIEGGEETPFDTEFFCPECGYAAPTDDSSMRAGDICPECRRGYIAERERRSDR